MRSLPVDVETKEWIDAKVSWILHQFGNDRIVSCTVVAADSELLCGFQKEDHAAILELFRKVCDLLGVDFNRIDFQLMNEPHNPLGERTLGLYQTQAGDRHTVTIDESLLASPVALLSTVAHELCHVHLIGDQRIAGDEDDQEPLTDLLAVFLGFGALAANSVLQEESWHEGHFGRWQMYRRGYLTMDMYGYALAIFAILRKESIDLWKPRLRLDVRSAFIQSVRYFEAHGLPDFSSVIDTQARPRLQATPNSSPPKPQRKLWRGYEDEEVEEFQDEVDFEYTDPESQSPSDGSSASESETQDECSYCGAKATRLEPVPLCAACFDSIQANEEEVEQHRREEAESIHAFRKVMGIGLLAFILLIFFVWLANVRR